MRVRRNAELNWLGPLHPLRGTRGDAGAADGPPDDNGRAGKVKMTTNAYLNESALAGPSERRANVGSEKLGFEKLDIGSRY